MSEWLFVDTAFVLALINRRDQYHQAALAVSQQSEGAPLLTTDAVLFEIGNALSRGYKSEAVQIIDEFLHADEVDVIHLNPALFVRAFTLYKTHNDKEWGLVDCLSFVVMRDRGVTQALTFDHHFTQAGFQVLMRKDS